MRRRLLFTIAAFCVAHASYGMPASQAETPLVEGQRDYNAGRYNRVVDGLTSAVTKAPNEAALHFLLGQSFYQLGEFPHAIASLERAVQLDPNNSEYHDWLGKSYGRKAEGSVFWSAMTWARKTHKEFEVAAQLNPGNFEAQRDLIRYEMNAPGMVGGGDDKALKHIDELDKIDSLQGQLARGEFLVTKREITKADTLFAKILESDSDRIGIYFEAGDYFRDRANPEKMGQAIAAAERIDANDRRLKYYRGVVLVMKEKKAGEAELLLKSYLATVPDNSDLPPHASAREWLGKLYEMQGRYSEAAEQFRLSLSLDPHNKSVEEALKHAEKK